MAHFYGLIDSHGRSKTDATRQGSKDSGMSGHVSGWDIGGRVVVGHNSNTKKDWCDIFATGGSNSSSGDKLARINESTEYGGKPELLLNWRLPKLLSEEEYIEMKESIAALIYEYKSNPDPELADGFNMHHSELLAEGIMDQLGFYLRKESKEN